MTDYIYHGDGSNNIAFAVYGSVSYLYGHGKGDLLFDYDYLLTPGTTPTQSEIAASDTFIYGGWGDDLLVSRGGNDVVRGGPGADHIRVIYDQADLDINGDTVTRVYGGRRSDYLELRDFDQNAVIITVDEATGDTTFVQGHKTVIMSHTIENWGF